MAARALGDGMRGRALRRWLVVALAAALLIAVPVVVNAWPAAAQGISPTALRAKVLASADVGYTGYARSRGDLGLPALPDLADVATLLSGTTDIRVWYAAADHNRVDTVDTVGERDVYTTPGGEYTWDYGQNLLTEVVGPQPVRLPRAGDLLPPDLARRVLALDTQDPVSALPAQRIAGIDAAGLRLRPTDPATTVGEVDIWADPASGLPLRVDVTAKGAPTATLTTQFVSVQRTTPDPSTLTPPDTGSASRTSAPDILGTLGRLTRDPLPAELAGYDRQPAPGGLPGVARYGAGLATFVVLPLPTAVGSSAFGTLKSAGATTVPVDHGRAESIQIPLLTVLLEQVGYGRHTYLVAGFVDPDVLGTAATELAAQQHRPRFVR
jgi:hypothetical protein